MVKGKKMLFLLAAVLLSLSVLMAGCGGAAKSANQNGSSKASQTGADNQGSGTDNSGKRTDAAASKLPPYQIDWYIIGFGPQPDTGKVEAAIDKIIQPKFNATLKMHIIPFADYDKKMTALLATGEKVDLMFTSNGNMNYNTEVGKGAFVDLTDKLDKDAPDAKKLLSGGFLQASMIKGRTYTLAAYKEKGSWLGFIANKNLMDKYQIDISKMNSLEDMEPALKTLKEKDPGSIPLLASGTTRIPNYVNRNLWDVSPVQSIVLKKDGSGYALELDQPAYMKTLQTLRKYYLAGYIPKDAAVMKPSKEDRAKAGFWFGQLRPDVAVQVSAAYGFPVEIHHFGKPITTTNDLVGSMMAIPTTSKNPDRTLMFYNLMYSDQTIYNLVANGIEGKHYIKIGPNRIDYPKGTGNGSKSGYFPNTNWAYGNQFLGYLKPGQSDDVWQQYKTFNAASVPVPDLGFNFDSSALRTQVAAIKNVENQYRPILETGSVDPAKYVPKFKAKLEAAGIGKVLQEMNKQYAAWKSSK